MRATLVPALFLALALPGAQPLQADARDLLIALPQAAKAGYGTALFVANLTKIGTQEPLGSLMGAVLTTAIALPSGLVLVNAAQGRGEETRFWRRVTMFTDAGLAATALGLGLYQILAPSSDPEGWGKLVGAILITVSIPIGLTAAVDTVPYSFEPQK